VRRDFGHGGVDRRCRIVEAALGGAHNRYARLTQRENLPLGRRVLAAGNNEDRPSAVRNLHGKRWV
jgi:hypothetical protein